MPNTVSFTEAIERLAYLYKEEEFTLEFIDDLYKLNDFRNNLTHFRYRLGDEEFMAVSKLFIKYSRKYSEHRWGSLPWEEKLDLKEFEEEVKSKEIGDKKLEYWILKSEFNEKILKNLSVIQENIKLRDLSSIAKM